MKPKPPCGKDCPDRAAGCHGGCEKYQAYRRELDASKPKNYAENDYTNYVKRIKLRNAMHRTQNTRRKWSRED